MSQLRSIKSNWFSLSDQILRELVPGEQVSLGLVGEESLYLRFNHGKVRQATTVLQQNLEIQFQSLGRKVSFNLSLTEDVPYNFQSAKSLIHRAREEAHALPADPSLSPLRNEGTSDQDLIAELPSERQAIEQIIAAHGSHDFAGFYSGGTVLRASRNSEGQNHWFSTACFFYDYSLFTLSASPQGGPPQNKAVKGNYSERNWSEKNLLKNIKSNTDLLPLLQRPVHQLKPGNYRAYLAPGAMNEILGTLISAFGAGPYKQGRSPFLQLAQQTEKLSPLFSLKENFTLGFCPQFNSLGEMAPSELPLIQNGELKNWIVSSKSAKEYEMVSNAGEITGWAAEVMRSPEIAPGTLLQEKALQALGTGVWLGNLHYLNWSDVAAARVTGMTRYACFWVENGQIKAPIQDMRFDESIYRLLGSQLEELTVEQTLEPDIMTYGRRELGARKFPGALVKEFKFTL
jgi:predicted Zn-dependent protease